jgi:hypothetical protein
MAVPFVVLTKHADRQDELTDSILVTHCFERATIVIRNIHVLYVYQESKQQEPE